MVQGAENHRARASSKRESGRRHGSRTHRPVAFFARKQDIVRGATKPCLQSKIRRPCLSTCEPPDFPELYAIAPIPLWTITIPLICKGANGPLHSSFVELTPPAVYSRCDTSPLDLFWPRVAGLGISLACLAVLILAAWLSPNPAGVGSHTRLGLQPCQFLARTGLPCPSCGMTTSFAWFVRGHVLNSLYVQPMGAVLAALTCCCVWAGLYVAATGRRIYSLLGRVSSRYYVVPLMAWALVAWAWKIFIHLHGIDGI